LVYQALINSDLAKRIGFKKLFVDIMLLGDKLSYSKITEDYAAELGDLNRFGLLENAAAFHRVMEANDRHLIVNPYRTFADKLIQKVQGLAPFTEETQLVAECRAHLTAYDDYILGLRINQALYEEQEKKFEKRMAELQAAYDDKVKKLLAAADRAGLLAAYTAELNRPTLVVESGPMLIEAAAGEGEE
jgi:hypothetical protein